MSMQPTTCIIAPISNQQLIDTSTFYDARNRNMHDQSQSCIYADTISMHMNKYAHNPAYGWISKSTQNIPTKVRRAR